MNRDRLASLALLGICLLLFSFQLGNRDFWDPDEPRYAGVARSILETGNWVSLSDSGETYTHKPPLLFWLIASVSRVAGRLDETTARVPSSLAAALCVLATYHLGSRLLSRRAAWIGALALGLTQRFLLEARWVHTDALLTLCVVLAIGSAYRALEGHRGGWVALYAWMAVGCLTKGPVAVALPVAGLLVFLASTYQLGRIRESGWFWGIPLALVPTLSWLVLSSHESGFAMTEVLHKQIFRRFGEGLHHPRPFYYYLYSLPLEFLPWTLFLPGMVHETFPLPQRKNRKNLLFLYAWAVGGLALLSISAEKRPNYLMPILPALALLVGAFWESYLIRYEASPVRPFVEWPLLLGGGVSLAGLGLILLRGGSVEGLLTRAGPLALGLALSSALALVASRRRRRGAVLLCLFAGLAACCLWIVGVILPAMDTHKSARELSHRVILRVGDAPLAIYEDPHPGLSYYTHRNLKVLRGIEALRRFLDDARGGMCILRREDLESLRNRIPVVVLERGTIGHRHLVLVARAAQSGDESASPR